MTIGSIAGLVGTPQGAVIYSTSKAAVHEYTRCLAAHSYAHTVFTPTSSRPARSSPHASWRAGRPATERKVREGPLTRYGWPEEVAKAVEFLVTEDGSYITGQVLRIDGGAQIFPS